MKGGVEKGMRGPWLWSAFDLDASYIGRFTFWRFTELYTHDMFPFLFVRYT